jgi:hypothetical protein
MVKLMPDKNSCFKKVIFREYVPISRRLCTWSGKIAKAGVLTLNLLVRARCNTLKSFPLLSGAGLGHLI